MAITRLGPSGSPRAALGGSGVASATITAAAFTEEQIVAGGQTIVIDLINATWATSGANFNAERAGIIAGLDSAQSETFGWNAEVRDKEVVTAVVRTSNTKVTITLTLAADYLITANETITVTVPATATTAGELTATPTVGVTNQGDDDRWDYTRGLTQTIGFAIVRDLAA